LFCSSQSNSDGVKSGFFFISVGAAGFSTDGAAVLTFSATCHSSLWAGLTTSTPARVGTIGTASVTRTPFSTNERTPRGSS